MWSRIIFITFVLATLGGFWFQRRYMAQSSAEYSAELTADRSKSELMSMTHFIASEYKGTQLSAALRANSAQMYMNGNVNLEGNLRYHDFNPNNPMVMESTKALGKMEVGQANQNFLDTSRRLKSVYLPDDVVITSKDDVLTTKELNLFLDKNLLTTKRHTRVIGPGRVLDATGFSYHTDTENYQLTGPVKGIYLPVSRGPAHP